MSSADESIWDATVASLCLVMFVELYIVLSTMPYAGYLVIHFYPDLDSDMAGKYSGWISASFMLGNVFMSLQWGRIADRVGRVFAVQSSLFFSGLFSLWFGFATTFPEALLARFFTGLACGVFRTVTTIACEYRQSHGNTNSPETTTTTHHDEAKNNHQAATIMSVLYGTVPVAFLLSPLVSGLLSDPLGQYDSLEQWFKDNNELSDTTFSMEGARFLYRFPYFLPNLLAAVLSALAMVLVMLFVPETLPSRAKGINAQEGNACCCSSWLCVGHRKGYQPLPLVEEKGNSTTFTSGTIQTKSESSSQLLSTVKLIWSQPLARRCLLPMWFLSFVAPTMDESFSLFCISTTGGLGLREASIGQIISTAGVLVVLAQYQSYQFMYKSFGLYGSIRYGAWLLPIASLFVPQAVLIQRYFSSSEESSLGLPAYAFLTFWMAVVRIAMFVTMTSLSVGSNRSVGPELRATMNGLSGMGGGLSRSLGPLFAGLLVSQSVDKFGSAAPWVIFGVVALVQASSATLASYCLSEQKIEDAEREMATRSQLSKETNRLLT